MDEIYRELFFWGVRVGKFMLVEDLLECLDVFVGFVYVRFRLFFVIVDKY